MGGDMAKTHTRQSSKPASGSGHGYSTASRSQQRGTVVSLTALAGTLMVLGGLWGVLVGIDALSASHVEVTAPASGYTYGSSITDWAWVTLILGIIVAAAGVCVFLGMFWARYVGASLAAISAIAGFIFIPYAPIWSIMMVILDVLIIWALLTPRRRPHEI
jgi:hypothetical protein